MKGAFLVALVVVIVVAGSGTAYVFWLAHPTGGSFTGPFEQFTTISGSTFVIINGTTTEKVVCTVAVPPPQGIYLRVVTDAEGRPISGLQVTTGYEANASCDSHNANLTTSVAVTNSSGWMLFQRGYPWYFAFTYSGHTYNFTINSDPMAWSSATISVPSGKLTTQICGLGGGSPNSTCQPAVTATIGSNG